MIRRTFTTTKAIILGINLETEIAETREIKLKGKNLSTRDILKAGSNENFSAMSVRSTEISETKWEISEEDFLANATEIKNETQKEN